MIPVAADVVFGINSNNSVDFSEYQIIDENRIFTTDNKQLGENLRVGIRFITPGKGEVIADDFGEYGPYSTILFFNSVEWDRQNVSGKLDAFHYKLTFYEDAARTSEVFVPDSSVSISGFSDSGEMFSTTGSVIKNGETKSYSYVPVGENPLKCNTFYFVKIESTNTAGIVEELQNDRSFIEACGTTYVDTIDFDFTNTGSQKDFHFRIRFYTDPERTALFKTVFSGNDTGGWTVGDDAIPATGLGVGASETNTITFSPTLSDFETAVTYYLSIDVFDGSIFTNNSNSFTFRARDIDTSIYCGEYIDVPVVKNFDIMFELEGNQFLTLKVN